MRWLLYGLAAVTLLCTFVFVTGALLPKAHVASVRAHYRQPPQNLYDAIINVAAGPAWRSGLDSVTVLSPTEWQETSRFGTLRFIFEQLTPARVVTRIADTSQGFGGGWTYEIAADSSGSWLTITENGEIYNPFFRFISKYAVGHYRTLETYARDLGRHFNEEVRPERVRP